MPDGLERLRPTQSAEDDPLLYPMPAAGAGNVQLAETHVEPISVPRPHPFDTVTIGVVVGRPLKLDFPVDEVKTRAVDRDDLILSFENGGKVVLKDYMHAFGLLGQQRTTIIQPDGKHYALTELLAPTPATKPEAPGTRSTPEVVIIEKPGPGETERVKLTAEKPMLLNFSMSDIARTETDKVGDLVVTFKDRAVLVLEGYTALKGSADIALYFANGDKVALAALAPVAGPAAETAESGHVFTEFSLGGTLGPLGHLGALGSEPLTLIAAPEPPNSPPLRVPPADVPPPNVAPTPSSGMPPPMDGEPPEKPVDCHPPPVCKPPPEDCEPPEKPVDCRPPVCESPPKDCEPPEKPVDCRPPPGEPPPKDCEPPERPVDCRPPPVCEPAPRDCDPAPKDDANGRCGADSKLTWIIAAGAEVGGDVAGEGGRWGERAAGLTARVGGDARHRGWTEGHDPPGPDTQHMAIAQSQQRGLWAENDADSVGYASEHAAQAGRDAHDGGGPNDHGHWTLSTHHGEEGRLGGEGAPMSSSDVFDCGRAAAAHAGEHGGHFAAVHDLAVVTAHAESHAPQIENPAQHNVMGHG